MSEVFIGAKVVIRLSGEIGVVFAHNGGKDSQHPWLVAELVEGQGYIDYDLYKSSEIFLLGSFGDACEGSYHTVINVWERHFIQYTVGSFLACYNDHVGLTQGTLEVAGLTLSGCVRQ